MDAKHILSQMADIFETTPDRWTHGAFARNKKNEAVDVLAAKAHSFSVNGFFERATGEGLLDSVENARAYDLFLGAVLQKFSHRNMVQVNDVEGREAVIACARLAAR